MKKRIYQPPAIKRVVAVCPESPQLAESVADKIKVRTMGHEVDPHGDYDFSSSPFEQPNWEP